MGDSSDGTLRTGGFAGGETGGRGGMKTVQEYIDEKPVWPDGTATSSAPMTAMQWRIWALATAGKFFEGMMVFMTGVALPLIVEEFRLDTVGKGLVGAAPLFGILIGATALGGLSDLAGRKRMFIAEMILFAVSLFLLVFSPGFAWLIVFLFIMGAALGCDYPTAHMVISESIPSVSRGKLVLSAFGFQAVGALVGTAVGYLILYENPDIGAWRWMYATGIVPAILVVVARYSIPDSGHWLVCRGRIDEAQRELERLLARRPPYPRKVRLAVSASEATPAPDAVPAVEGFRSLFSRRHFRATVFASVPWFLQDLGTYGIGMFTPTILASVIGSGTTHAGNIAGIIHTDMLAAKGAAFIDCLLLVGIVFAVLLADRAGRVRLQVLGFIGCAAGLFLASLSAGAGGGTGKFLIFAGFMLFSFMTNLGPNAMTYLIAGEVFPTRIRGKGAGFAASFAKVGSVLTVFLFPLLLRSLGTKALLYGLVGTSLLGALITWLFRIETTGVNLENIGRTETGR
ncbi:MAG TPA: MFS transporter [Syntrophales bacterium]|nr:MFS transporter [Syntrophales bacterium]HQN76791.1 MFS transporter [Syntrophales bacterium]HQQ27465.1 MFS transporter [Syntrophales bacterium]